MGVEIMAVIMDPLQAVVIMTQYLQAEATVGK
jgi:hypothetical protein